MHGNGKNGNIYLRLSSNVDDLNHDRDQLDSIESAFRLEIQKFETQLNDLIALKAQQVCDWQIRYLFRFIRYRFIFQDEEIKRLRESQRPKPATRNIRLQWSPPSKYICTQEVASQAEIRPESHTISTFTESKYLPKSVEIQQLENVINQRDNRIRYYTYLLSAITGSYFQKW